MKDSRLQQVIKLARSLPENDQVPYAFEKRIMARLSERTSFESSGFLARVMWQAAVTSVAITILTGALAQFAGDRNAPDPLGGDLEAAVLGPIAAEGVSW